MVTKKIPLTENEAWERVKKSPKQALDFYDHIELYFPV